MNGAVKFAICFAALVLPRAASAQFPAATLNIEPREIQADIFYSGTEIQVGGEAPVSYDLAVVCTGSEDTVELKRKGKVWGLIWLNVGDVAFEHVPAFYQLASSKKFNELGSNAELIRAGVGSSALEARIVSDDDQEQRRLFSELMKLKMHEGLYSIREGALKKTLSGAGTVSYSTKFYLPSSIGSGSYKVRLLGFNGGNATTLAEEVFHIRMAGMAALIRSFSLEHGLLYGILSVFIALAAGLLTGVIFGQRGSKGAH